MQINNTTFLNKINVKSLGSLLTPLNVADSIRAQVAGATSDGLMLRLPDGSTIQAASLAELQNLLLSMDIKPDEKNMEVLKQLMQYKLPVTKEQFDMITNLLYQFKNLTADKAAFILSNQIHPNDNNIQLLNNILDKDASIGKDLLHISKILEDVNTMSGSEVSREIIDTINKNVKNIFIQIDRLKTEDRISELNISKVIEDLSELIKSLRNPVNGSIIIQDKELQAILNKLENKLNLIDQIQDNFVYMQIPININQHYTTAELYIMKDAKKKKKIDPSNTTIFISLSTANLGQVEALIKIVKKSVECDFQIEDIEILDFVKKNITPLYGLLEAQGYKLIKVNYMEQKDKTDLLDMIGVMQNKDIQHSFDVKV